MDYLRKTSLRFAVPAVCIAAFSGCGFEMVKYVPPSSAESAKIRFINKANMNLDIAFYEISQGCQKRRSINIMTPGEQSLQTIPANQEVTFQFLQSSASSSRYCLQNIRFTPQAGRNYEFEVKTELMQCVWRMVEQEEGSPSKPVPFTVVPWKAGWDENGSFCKK